MGGKVPFLTNMGHYPDVLVKLNKRTHKTYSPDTICFA